MKKMFLFVIALLVSVFVAGCGMAGEGDSNQQTGSAPSHSKNGGEEKPPDVDIEVDGEKHETRLTSYVWGDEGVDEDDVSPVGYEIRVQSHDKLTFVMDDAEREIDVAYLSQYEDINDMDPEEKIKVKENEFTAPEEKGTYHYLYEVTMTDGNEADYLFALEVK